MESALFIEVGFTRNAYSGGDLGSPEEIPSPARVHSAFLAAAAGGPDATVSGRVLVATEEARNAVRWLEDHEPLGIKVPGMWTTHYGDAQRYRLRAAPAPHLDRTSFEPFTALDGGVVYAWPAPGDDTVEALRAIAPEITHVGRADSIALVSVRTAREDDDDLSEFATAADGRGPGRVLRIAMPGRLDALEAAHADAHSKGRHDAGSAGKQASDHQIAGAAELATALRRFTAADHAGGPWPFAEAWRLPFDGDVPRWALNAERRVAFAVAVHRAVVRAIGNDVPPFVTGRDGDGPLRGPGHLAIHPVDGRLGSPGVVLAMPTGVDESDRAALADALSNGLRVRFGKVDIRLGAPSPGPAAPFWSTDEPVLRTDVPLVLDNAGSPRHGFWTLDDAVLCSVGYALRGLLESEGWSWGTGWEARRALVDELRRRGAWARAARVTHAASRYAHRAPAGQLLVAADAVVGLGDLLPLPGPFLAIGRSRHLGGGLLVPVGVPRP